MKKTTSKSKKRTHCASETRLRVDNDVVKAMRTVNDGEAFHFYEAVGRPTGAIARNLPEFLDKIKSSNAESLLFHHARQDFQNWAEKALGDSKLARKLEKIASSNGDEVKTEICRAVESHLKQLKNSAPAILVDENHAVLQVSS